MVSIDTSALQEMARQVTAGLDTSALAGHGLTPELVDAAVAFVVMIVVLVHVVPTLIALIVAGTD